MFKAMPKTMNKRKVMPENMIKRNMMPKPDISTTSPTFKVTPDAAEKIRTVPTKTLPEIIKDSKEKTNPILRTKHNVNKKAAPKRKSTSLKGKKLTRKFF